MPDIKPRDYTTGELTHAANVCDDAAKLLEPASNELMRIVDDIEPERPGEALLYARTARHLGGAVFHLKASEATIRQITENVGRTYKGVSALLSRIASVISLVVPAMILSELVLPAHIGHIIASEARIPAGFGMGIVIANLIILYRRTRREQRRDSQSGDSRRAV